jgi:hypothetical protein
MNSELDELINLADDWNNRRYFARRQSTNEIVGLCFRPFGVEDIPKLTGPKWTPSVFGDWWMDTATNDLRRQHLLKLVRSGSPPSEVIEGLLYMEDGPEWPKNSILEAANSHRFGAIDRELIGVGRVLIARIVAESVGRGLQGGFFVEIASDATAFYETIGARVAGHRAFFSRPVAALLYQSVTR